MIRWRWGEFKSGKAFWVARASHLFSIGLPLFLDFTFVPNKSNEDVVTFRDCFRLI